MGKKSKPDTPELPDPMEMLRAQAQYNRYDQNGPFGSVSWQQGPGGGYTQNVELSDDLAGALSRITGRMNQDQGSYQRPPQMDAMMQNLMNGQQSGYVNKPAQLDQAEYGKPMLPAMNKPAIPQQTLPQIPGKIPSAGMPMMRGGEQGGAPIMNNDLLAQLQRLAR